MATNAPITGTPTRAPFLDRPRPVAMHELRMIRAALIERINVAADKRRCTSPMEGMPHTLLAAGCYLAFHGLADDACEGERFFATDAAHYAGLATCPEMVEAGRRAIYDGRRAILPLQPMQVAA